MSNPGYSRRKQQLLDKFLAGEIDKATYDSLLAHLDELGVIADGDGVAEQPPSAGSEPSFQVTESRTEAERSALASPVPLLEAGMELGGFQLKRRLRRGGMGEVWQAYDATGERMVVIKVLPPELQRSPDEMSRVKQTFNRVHTLQHQHICPVYLLGQDPRFGYFIVMKYLDGDTLSACRKGAAQRGEFGLRDVVRVLTPIAHALDYAHGRQIIHRDIKPQNIMLSADGGDVQLVDFGLAAEVRTSVMRVSQAQMETCGTYPYMAPEQWRGEMQDARTDQYALAVVAFELLAGHLPYEAADPTILRMCVLNDPVPAIAKVPAAVNAAIARGMSKSRPDRFGTCTEFINALAGAESGAVTPVDREPVDLEPDDDEIPWENLKAPGPVPGSTPSTPDPVVLTPPSAIRPPLSGTPGGTSRPASGRPAAIRPAGAASGSRVPTSDDGLFDDANGAEPRKVATNSSRKPARPAPGVRQVRGEVAMEQANARAMFWVSLVGGTICLTFFAAFGWFVWTGAQWLAGPSQNASNTIPPETVAANGNGNATVPASVPAPGAVVPGAVVPGAAVPAPAAPPAPGRGKGAAGLRYAWEPGRPYQYSVKLELEPDPDVVVSLGGNATYIRGQPVARGNSDPDAGKGTGTGFVVQPDGYLVTCQHVVDNAAEIEVAIGGQKYPAKVIVQDVEHDLAIIRIEAAELPTLPLADSDKVQLGQEVRAIGFPFSSILGDNVKATRGTISGINHEDDHKVFQVDAGINPGNSGGPLVNELGEVIGVNFAKLREEVATNVGFAVPINDAIALLRSENVPFTGGQGKSSKLDGPELVKRVAAATALITVNGEGGAAAGLHHFELRCTGQLNSSVHSKSGKLVNPSITRQHLPSLGNFAFSQPDVVETDPLGHVHEITGQRSPLPGFMGPLARMVLEQLPSIRRPNWSHNFAITVVISEESGDPLGMPSRLRPRFRPRGFPEPPGFPGGPRFPGGEARKSTRIPGKVRIAYTVQEAAGDLVRIRKEFDLEAREPGAAQPRVKLTGNGIFTFDATAGVPRQLDYTATLVETENNATTKLPIRLTYQLVDNPGPANIAQAPAAAVAPGKPVEPATALVAGTRLVAEWAGKWLPVEVLEVKQDGKVRIHWTGWGAQFDEDVARSRLRFPAGVDPQPVAAAPAAVTPAPQEAPLKLSVAEIDQCLADLQGSNAGRANLAASKLQRGVPLAERQDQVLAAMQTQLKLKDPFRRKQAVEVLGTWARPETIPLLIQCLDEPALLVKLAAIDTLGKLKDGRAAGPLAKLVTEPGPRVQAVKALVSLGAVAETAVLELLVHTEPDVRREACRLLKEIGTARSLPALHTAAADEDQSVATSAKEAATAISDRK